MEGIRSGWHPSIYFSPIHPPLSSIPSKNSEYHLALQANTSVFDLSHRSKCLEWLFKLAGGILQNYLTIGILIFLFPSSLRYLLRIEFKRYLLWGTWVPQLSSQISAQFMISSWSVGSSSCQALC